MRDFRSKSKGFGSQTSRGVKISNRALNTGIILISLIFKSKRPRDVRVIVLTSTFQIYSELLCRFNSCFETTWGCGWGGVVSFVGTAARVP